MKLVPHIILLLLACFFSQALALDSIEPAKEPLETFLIGESPEALSGIDKLYLIFDCNEQDLAKNGVELESLRQLTTIGFDQVDIEIVDNNDTILKHDIPELHISIETLDIPDSNLCVYRIESFLYSIVKLPKNGLFMKARIWNIKPDFEIINTSEISTTITKKTLGQAEAFIELSKMMQTEDLNSKAKTEKLSQIKSEQENSISNANLKKTSYAASKKSKVFHDIHCSSVQQIKKTNLIEYKTRADALRAGKRPCKICKP